MDFQTYLRSIPSGVETIDEDAPRLLHAPFKRFNVTLPEKYTVPQLVSAGVFCPRGKHPFS